jgi:hypothetical protein
LQKKELETGLVMVSYMEQFHEELKPSNTLLSTFKQK